MVNMNFLILNLKKENFKKSYYYLNWIIVILLYNIVEM